MYSRLRYIITTVALAVLPLIVRAEEHKNYFGAGLELSKVDLTGVIENLSGTTGRVAEKIDTNLETLAITLKLRTDIGSVFPTTFSVNVVYPEINQLRDEGTVKLEGIPALEYNLNAGLQLYKLGMGVEPGYQHNFEDFHLGVIFPLNVEAGYLHTSVDYRAWPKEELYRNIFESLDIDTNGSLTISGPIMSLNVGVGIQAGYRGLNCEFSVGDRYQVALLEIEGDDNNIVGIQDYAPIVNFGCGKEF